MATGKKRGAQAPRPRSGFATEEMRHTERLMLRVPVGTVAGLDELAERWGVTRSGAVAKLIEEEFWRFPKAPSPIDSKPVPEGSK